MAWKIKNYKLALLSAVCFGIFISLGMWQLRRADEKMLLLKTFGQRAHAAPLTADKLINHEQDLRFYRAQLEGVFDNEHTILLDNKTHHGKIGYEVYTPFMPLGSSTAILVDRGFVQSSGRRELPSIPPINEPTTVVGLVNEPPRFAALGEMIDGASTTWPLRVEYIDLQKLDDQLHTNLFPYILTLDPKHAAAFDLEWEIVIMGPERHQGYALQWFAFALTLLILFATLNVGKKE